MLKPKPSLGLLADLLDGLDIGLCAFDAEDRTLAWNQTFLYLFPEHDGFVHAGEPYRENLLRFYRTRLTSDELPYIEEYVASGIARHQAQTRPFEFEHRGTWLQVSAQTIPGLGRVRLWRQITRAAEPSRSNPADVRVGAPDGIAAANADGRIVSANWQFGQLYGLPPGEAVGLTLEAVVARAWQEAYDDAPAQLLAHVREAQRFAGAPFEVPLPGERWIRVIERVREGGARTGFHFDISALKREQAALRAEGAEARRSASLFRGIIEHAPAGMLVVGADGRLAEANRAFRSALGDGPDPVGRPLAALVLPEDAGVLDAVLAEVQAQGAEDRGPAIGEMRFPRRDGSPMWARVSAVRLHLPPDPVATLLQVEDITARREAERRIAHMARHDALTDLPNRTLFRERLDALLRDGAGAVLWLDLDRFKVVNDTLGHAAGDALLCEVARRLRAVLAPGDTIARLGGDEFAVLLADGDPLAASRAAATLIEAMQVPVAIAGRPMHVGVSIGVVLAPRHGGDADTLMARADRALYSAKAAGRSTFRLYDPGMDAALAEQHDLELDLRLGLERGEFELHYQPIVTADERRVVCREALVRWRHPTRGLVPPAAFIPLAETTGLIDRLGTWILRRACRDAAAWRDGTRVAVNVSAAQVRHGSLIAAVQSSLRDSGLGADRLEIEITESLLIDGGEAVDLLPALRRLGARIALDDFGTGYSSLSYLRRFPFDTIKIDRSFIADIADPDTAAIVRAVVGIAAQLGATVTAEGIETEAQLAAVRQAGCTEAQGFLFGRPAPLEAGCEEAMPAGG
ncbi:PAS domain S-box-containing protein/diguanylate cyclase (GGDEF) domain-containing protein [Methylobacterium sp. 174MFSha1.1]|uniref:EAL domain-containing protein n=1 Tax=Methylobacterium sp. 174MFSha1.1 TaxID=1502749 RepID=UPI0008E39483|nr:EAL domain-containing protein [Methylobacterium sp. 174MFSha1.1]SFV16510.1 PAS domain S-box-containing protein/diguanylate cyclase (GGDEF) domain-containing protein [Methylobacterium sp. 174MFSha1.1]